MLGYIILGILHGVFEWLPLSSEAIVTLANEFVLKKEISNSIDLSLFLHFGTLLAVLIYFKKDWREILELKNIKLLYFLTIATITSLILGFPLYKLVKNVAVGNFLLLITGFGLFFTGFLRKKEKKFKNRDYNLKLALIAGFFQGLAVIPGVSRSGVTIFALSLGGFSFPEVLKISYMMSLPVVFLSSFYLLLKNPILIFEGWISLIFSFLVGIFTLDFLIKLTKKVNFSKIAFFFGFLCILSALINFFVKFY